MQQASIYSLKVWATVVLVSPLFIAGVISLLTGTMDLRSDAMFYVVALALGILFGVPCAIIFTYASLLATQHLKQKLFKPTITVVYSMLIAGVFILIGYQELSTNSKALLFLGGYSITGFISIWAYNSETIYTENEVSK